MGRKTQMPSEAKAAILNTLTEQKTINADQIADILEQHGVAGDPDELQRGYRKRVGQRMLASYRDAQGRREILAGDKGEYVVVEYCENLKTLQTIQNHLRTQMTGLDNSASKVTGRIYAIKNLPFHQDEKAG